VSVSFNQNTPTIILFARNQGPKHDSLKAVLGIKGEPLNSIDPAEGKVWNSIVNNIELSGFENEYVSIVAKERTIFSAHPWSLNGGGADDVYSGIVDASEVKLEDIVRNIGFVCMTRADDVYFSVKGALQRNSLQNNHIIKNVIGENVRNWGLSNLMPCCFPYDENLEPTNNNLVKQYLWPHRNALWLRREPNGNHLEIGLTWYQWSRFQADRYKVPLSITFPFVSTHNHFVLDRGGKVFNRTSPVIKLPKGTSEADHLVLLGLLNSSVACFWGRQVFFSKRGEDVGKWGEFMEFDGTKLKRFPIPNALDESVQDDTRLLPGYPTIEHLAQQIDALAQTLAEKLPATVIDTLGDNLLVERLDTAKLDAADLRSQMVALQEELDWHCYQAYGLLDDLLVFEGELPRVKAGERAFEIKMARELSLDGGSAAWFTRHELVQTAEIPSHWPDVYKALVEKRLAVMQSERFIKLIEKPEYKRRWLPFEWDKLEQTALQNWLLTFLEQKSFDVSNPTLLTCAQLADSINKDEMAQAVAQRYTDNELFEAQPLTVNLVSNENIPQMAAGRLKPDAMKKFRAWQETWDKQRQEDAIDVEFGVDQPLSELDATDAEKLESYQKLKLQATVKKAEKIGDIPLPPKYAKSDFKSPAYWPLRGKLDVPKERFFSLPGCEKEGDATLVIGWAGMNHLQRAQAIAAWYLDRKEGEGWEAEKLMPMLVALDELTPWLKQWHNDIDPEFGERMGDYYEAFLMEELRMLNVSRDELLRWQPPAAPKKKRATKKKKSAAAE